MTSLGLFAILLTLAAVFGVVNARTLRLPTTIGVLVFALLASLVMLAINPLIPGYDLRVLSRQFLDVVDLPHTLLNGALSFLLFAGALQVDLTVLLSRKLAVLALALIATLLAVLLFGGAMWLIFPFVGPAVPFIWCIVLGAILAPTDPVSVIGMLRRIGLPAPLQAVFAGESLFNDGVGVVVALGYNVSRYTAPGKVTAYGKCQSYCGIEMRPTNSPHEIYNGHDHDAGCHGFHAQCYGAVAYHTGDASAGRHHDEQECAPGFREKPPPLVRRYEKVRHPGRVQHAGGRYRR
jgi:CPA1 family monovalent cation:H+ antiporter